MFTPNFVISPGLAKKLIEIERLSGDLRHAPMNESILSGLRETALIHTVHYSTMIEGNQLTMVEVQTVLKNGQAPAGRERDEGEVRGYFAAINQVMDWIAQGNRIAEPLLKKLHAIVMAEGGPTAIPSPYRGQQNVIRNSSSGTITYMPPEPQDVPELMADLVDWLNDDDVKNLPGPIIAGLLHYQFVTIHPYLDGNGRTARLLTSWQMHLSGYGLNGIYSMEEHYAKNLWAYYAALALGPSHNYYMGRAETDLTPWLEYFIDGVLRSLRAVAFKFNTGVDTPKAQMVTSAYLDGRKSQVLESYGDHAFVRTKDLAVMFGISDRAARNLAVKWVSQGFLKVEDVSKKARLYRVTYGH